MALDIALALAGLAMIAFGGDSALELVGAGISVLGAGLLGRDLYRRFRRRSDFRLSDNPDFPALIDEPELAKGYRLVRFGGTTCATSEEVNALLDGAANAIDLDPARYQVPDPIWEHHERFVELGAVAYNERKVRLRTDLTPALLKRGDRTRVQPTDYFSGVATNDKAAQQLEHCGDDRRRQQWSLNFAMSDLVFEGGRLIDLADSVLSNHIGLTALLITADHRIVYQQQGDQAVDSRCFNLGSSGSLDLSDIYHSPSGSREKRLRTLQDAVRHGMEREAAEETSAAVGPGKSSTILTGHARYLDRGGKPEFFGILRTASKLDNLKATRAERDFVHLIKGLEFEPTQAGLIAAIDELLRRCEASPAQHSPSMTVGLRLARSHVERSGFELPPLPAA